MVVYPCMLINVGKLVNPKEGDIYATGDTTIVKMVRDAYGTRPAATVDADVRRYVRTRWIRMSNRD
jgi:hypothetical protein